jgi:exosortase/archaeosortase family protein
MNQVHKKVVDFAIRYLILVLIAFPGLVLFYKIFTPLTIYPSYWIFSIFFNTSIYSNIILLNSATVIEIVPACIMGSAYYLLLILNLSIPDINLKKRLTMILTSFAALLIVNVIRIVILGSLYNFNSILGDPLHTFFWYFLSIFFVVGIWFAQVKIFRIKGIPFYTDLKFLFEKSSIKINSSRKLKNKKKTKKKNKNKVSKKKTKKRNKK